MENELAGVLSQVDFGAMALFSRASFLVKIVMMILISASVWAWSIVLSKWLQMRSARKNLENFSHVFWSGKPLEEVFSNLESHTDNEAERVFMSGMREWRKNHDSNGVIISGSDERIERAMNISLTSLRHYWEEGLGVLATIGATAPFVGLLGTVWGIKTAFQDIALTGNTNLAVVAPGIAEALVATALGLFAAIPAVIFYNKYSNDVERMVSEHASFAEEFALLISRQTKMGRG